MSYPDLAKWRHDACGRPPVVVSEKELNDYTTQRLNETILESESWTDAPAPEILSMLRKATGLNIVVLRDADIEDVRVTMRIVRSSAGEVLRQLLTPLGRTWGLRDGLVVIRRAA